MWGKKNKQIIIFTRNGPRLHFMSTPSIKSICIYSRFVHEHQKRHREQDIECIILYHGLPIIFYSFIIYWCFVWSIPGILNMYMYVWERDRAWELKSTQCTVSQRTLCMYLLSTVWYSQFASEIPMNRECEAECGSPSKYTFTQQEDIPSIRPTGRCEWKDCERTTKRTKQIQLAQIFHHLCNVWLCILPFYWVDRCRSWHILLADTHTQVNTIWDS